MTAGKIERPAPLSRWRLALGLDFHVLVTILFRGWTVLAGASMLFLLPVFLGPVPLGYHYTFASLLALQVFFELGMNQVVTQITSHEIAHLEVHRDGSFTGPTPHLDRLASLARMLRRWYAVAALLFAVVVGPAGVVFFASHPKEVAVPWLGPWLTLTVATAANLYLSPTLAMLEGAGRVGQVARLRLVQSIVGYAVMALVLVGGAGLWASTALAVVAALGTSAWLRRDGEMIRWLRRHPAQTDARVAWREEIFPFQWRIALSWMSGYFIFQLFTPMLFSNQGAIEAGRFGIVLAMFSAVQQIGMGWIYSRSPQMAAHIARGERAPLNRLFLQALRPSTAFTALACACLVTAGWTMSHLGMPLARRLSSPEVIFWLGLTNIVNAFVFAMAVYIRSHKEEPMVAASLTLAGVVLAIAHWASRVSVELTAQCYFWATLLISLPWFFVIFLRYWKRP
jgi:hypothetical protein